MLPPESVDVAPNHISLAKEGQRVMPSFMEMGKHVLMVGHGNPLRIKVVTSAAAITGTCLKIKRNSEEYAMIIETSLPSLNKEENRTYMKMVSDI